LTWGDPLFYDIDKFGSLLQNGFFVILNEVKDLSLLGTLDSSLRSE
jgi:hypothetical protein